MPIAEIIQQPNQIPSNPKRPKYIQMLKATTCQTGRFPSDSLCCISLSLRPVSVECSGEVENVPIPGSNLASWIPVHRGKSWRYGLNLAIRLEDTAGSFLSPQRMTENPHQCTSGLLVVPRLELPCQPRLNLSYYVVLIKSGTSTMRVESAILHWYWVHSKQLQYNLLRQHADYMFPYFSNLWGVDPRGDTGLIYPVPGPKRSKTAQGQLAPEWKQWGQVCMMMVELPWKAYWIDIVYRQYPNMWQGNIWCTFIHLVWSHTDIMRRHSPHSMFSHPGIIRTSHVGSCFGGKKSVKWSKFSRSFKSHQDLDQNNTNCDLKSQAWSCII